MPEARSSMAALTSSPSGSTREENLESQGVSAAESKMEEQEEKASTDEAHEQEEERPPMVSNCGSR